MLAPWARVHTTRIMSAGVGFTPGASLSAVSGWVHNAHVSSVGPGSHHMRHAPWGRVHTGCVTRCLLDALCVSCVYLQAGFTLHASCALCQAGFTPEASHSLRLVHTRSVTLTEAGSHRKRHTHWGWLTPNELQVHSGHVKLSRAERFTLRASRVSRGQFLTRCVMVVFAGFAPDPSVHPGWVHTGWRNVQKKSSSLKTQNTGFIVVTLAQAGFTLCAEHRWAVSTHDASQFPRSGFAHTGCVMCAEASRRLRQRWFGWVHPWNVTSAQATSHHSIVVTQAGQKWRTHKEQGRNEKRTLTEVQRVLPHCPQGLNSRCTQWQNPWSGFHVGWRAVDFWGVDVKNSAIEFNVKFWCPCSRNDHVSPLWKPLDAPSEAMLDAPSANLWRHVWCTQGATRDAPRDAARGALRVHPVLSIFKPESNQCAWKIYQLTFQSWETVSAPGLMQISVTHAACSLQSCRSSYRSRVGPGGRGLHAFRAQEFLQIQGQEGGSYMPSELQELVGSRVRRREGAASLQSCRSCIRSRVRREGAAYLQSCRSSCISRVRRGRGLHAFRAAGACWIQGEEERGGPESRPASDPQTLKMGKSREWVGQLCSTSLQWTRWPMAITSPPPQKWFQSFI